MAIASWPASMGFINASTIYGNVGSDYITDAIETHAQRTHRSPGTFSNLWVNCDFYGGGTGTFRFRKNLANGNQVVSVTASGEFEDTTNTDAVIAGDEINYQLVHSGGMSLSIGVIFILFDADTNTVEALIAHQGVAHTSASTTWFKYPGGNQFAPRTGETLARHKVRTIGTWRNLFVNVLTWSRSTNTTVRNRINGSNGSMSVSVGATGFFEDTVNSDTLAVDDLISYSVTNGTGSGTYEDKTLASELETTNRAWPFMWCHLSGFVISATVNYYLALGGNDTSSIAVDDVATDCLLDFTWSKMAILISVNGLTDASTLTNRINAGAGTMSISIGASATGLFEDLVNSDSVVAADEIAYFFESADTGTDIQIVAIDSLAQALVAPVAPVLFIHEHQFAV